MKWKSRLKLVGYTFGLLLGLPLLGSGIAFILGGAAMLLLHWLSVLTKEQIKLGVFLFLLLGVIAGFVCGIYYLVLFLRGNKNTDNSRPDRRS